MENSENTKLKANNPPENNGEVVGFQDRNFLNWKKEKKVNFTFLKLFVN